MTPAGAGSEHVLALDDVQWDSGEFKADESCHAGSAALRVRRQIAAATHRYPKSDAPKSLQESAGDRVRKTAPGPIPPVSAATFASL